jgi:chromosome segregation ATPase
MEYYFTLFAVGLAVLFALLWMAGSASHRRAQGRQERLISELNAEIRQLKPAAERLKGEKAQALVKLQAADRACAALNEQLADAHKRLSALESENQEWGKQLQEVVRERDDCQERLGKAGAASRATPATPLTADQRAQAQPTLPGERDAAIAERNAWAQRVQGALVKAIISARTEVGAVRVLAAQGADLENRLEQASQACKASVQKLHDSFSQAMGEAAKALGEVNVLAGQKAALDEKLAQAITACESSVQQLQDNLIALGPNRS